MSVPAGEGSQKRRKGCLAGTFLSFISRFFLYLNLQICIIQGQPIKEEYNGGRWESEVCVGKAAVVGPFHLPGMAILFVIPVLGTWKQGDPEFKFELSYRYLRLSWTTKKTFPLLPI